MAFEVFPWNEWIQLVIAGRAEAFVRGLTRAVGGSVFFRAKRSSEIRMEYGVEVEDVVQTLALELLDKRVLDDFIRRALSDEEIAVEITVRIRSRIVDAFRKRQRESQTFVAAADDNLFETRTSQRPESQERTLLMKETVELISSKLDSDRRTFIFKNYRKFTMGDLDTSQLAGALGVSIQTIHKDISEIKKIIRNVAAEIQHPQGMRLCLSRTPKARR
jgi:hypothetical protein